MPLVRVHSGSTDETRQISAFSETVGLLYLDSRLKPADLSAGNRELLQTLPLAAYSSMVLFPQKMASGLLLLLGVVALTLSPMMCGKFFKPHHAAAETRERDEVRPGAAASAAETREWDQVHPGAAAFAAEFQKRGEGPRSSAAASGSPAAAPRTTPRACRPRPNSTRTASPASTPARRAGSR